MKRVFGSILVLSVLSLPCFAWAVNYSIVESPVDVYIGYYGGSISLEYTPSGGYSYWAEPFCCGGMPSQSQDFFIIADDGSYGTEVYMDVGFGVGFGSWVDSYNMTDVSGEITWIATADIGGVSFAGESGGGSIRLVTTTEERIRSGIDNPYSAYVDTYITGVDINGTAINPDEYAFVTVGSQAGASMSSGNIRPVPEPSTMLLLGSGLAGLVGFRKKFKT